MVGRIGNSESRIKAYETQFKTNSKSITVLPGSTVSEIAIALHHDNSKFELGPAGWNKVAHILGSHDPNQIRAGVHGNFHSQYAPPLHVPPTRTASTSSTNAAEARAKRAPHHPHQDSARHRTYGKRLCLKC